MLTAERIKDWERFTEAHRKLRPNSPIIQGYIATDGEPVHLTIDDVAELVNLAKNRLSVREAMKLSETPTWAWDEGRQRVVRVDMADPNYRRIMAAL